MLSLVIIGGLRLCMRQYFMGDWFTAAQHVPFANRDDGLTKVAIYGAGVAGNQLVAALRMGRVLRPVAFIDDDPSIADRSIAWLQVYKPAGGSIGVERCRQIFSLGPTTLLLFEHSEFNLYSFLSELEQRACRKSVSVKLLPILGSIRHRDKLLDVMKTWGVDAVYHAAAYKHVPMVERDNVAATQHPMIRTNTLASARSCAKPSAATP